MIIHMYVILSADVEHTINKFDVVGCPKSTVRHESAHDRYCYTMMRKEFFNEPIMMIPISAWWF
jgi:hypothetical protein